jgi:hypothetical protein
MPEVHTLNHSIHVVTSEMGGAGGPAYNHIAFRDQTGTDKVLMYGLAIARKSSSVRALRGVMAPPSDDGLPVSHFSRAGEVCIFSGDVKDYLRRMAMAVEALHFINAQNLNYRPEDVNGDSPNSIAHTLVTAMGLEFPAEASQYWAPGHERIILPRNWRSAYAA